MSKLRILLDNGHGKNTPGKCSLRWADGAQLYEYEFNRDIVRRIADKLASKGITFDIITPELTDIPLHQRANRVNHICNVNGVKNCLLISIHSNASENHNATGWEVWTTPGKTLSDSYAELFYKKHKLLSQVGKCGATQQMATTIKRLALLSSANHFALPY